MPPTRELARYTGMCPAWESNRQPFGWEAYAQSTEPHQPGQSSLGFYLWLPNCSTIIFGKAVPPPLNCFCAFVKSQYACLCGSVSMFFVLLHWSLASPPPVPAQSWLLQLHGKPSYRQRDTPTSFFLLKTVGAILGPTPLHIHVRLSPSVSTKIFARILIGISLNPEVCLRVSPPILSSQTVSWNNIWSVTGNSTYGIDRSVVMSWFWKHVACGSWNIHAIGRILNPLAWWVQIGGILMVIYLLDTKSKVTIRENGPFWKSDVSLGDGTKTGMISSYLKILMANILGSFLLQFL